MTGYFRRIIGSALRHRQVMYTLLLYGPGSARPRLCHSVLTTYLVMVHVHGEWEGSEGEG